MSQTVGKQSIRLGVNIDHIATLRQLRKTPYPNLIEAAHQARLGGADQITVHLREDRRHIQDQDVLDLKAEVPLPLNLEMAISPDVVQFALRIQPDWVCLVPEKRKELTTEGGLDLIRNHKGIGKVIEKLKKSKIQVSCFIEPQLKMVRMSRELGADAVEIHTGQYCLAAQGYFGARSQKRMTMELKRIQEAALGSHQLGLRVHAGHGFDYQNILPVMEWLKRSRMPKHWVIEEFNIGHSIICQSTVVGLKKAVRQMKSLILDV